MEEMKNYEAAVRARENDQLASMFQHQQHHHQQQLTTSRSVDDVGAMRETNDYEYSYSDTVIFAPVCWGHKPYERYFRQTCCHHIMYTGDTIKQDLLFLFFQRIMEACRRILLDQKYQHFRCNERIQKRGTERGKI